MQKILLLIILTGLLIACQPPPLNPSLLQGIKTGQTRNQVLTMIKQQPDNVVHTTFSGSDYIVYYYRLQTGTKTTLLCNTPTSCRRTKEMVFIPYLFIFKNANQPKLLYYGSLEKMKTSPYSTERNLVNQLQIMHNSL